MVACMPAVLARLSHSTGLLVQALPETAAYLRAAAGHASCLAVSNMSAIASVVNQKDDTSNMHAA